MNRRAIVFATAALALGAGNVVAWRGSERTITTTTVVERASNGTRAVPTDQLVTSGRSLFRAKGCAACHVDVQAGPDLTNLAARAGKTKPGLDAEQYIRESIVAPAAFRPTTAAHSSSQMPTLPIDAAELDALTAYLLTL
jgi:mono/diheme cytochrome c family protein